jgi:hypothetical protein
MSTLIEAEDEIKTIAAVHSQCRTWVIFDRDEASSRSRHVSYALKAEVKLGHWASAAMDLCGLMARPGA